MLVDHNGFAQSSKGIEKAKILKVIDHHKIAEFETSEPLFYLAMPVGCTNTILYNMYKIYGIEIEPTIAGLMLSAIISDTLLFKSPTCTPKDEEAAKELAKIANVDINKYGLEMLKAGTDLSSFSIDEILHIDAKKIDFKEVKSIVNQVNTASIEEVMTMKNELEARMNEIIEEENLDLFMLLITDIVNSNSQVIALGKSASLVEKSYGVKLENNTALLEGVVSRKKQVVPIMTENA
jgi:manganese-dependent inorganic pyrophosphatase